MSRQKHRFGFLGHPITNEHLFEIIGGIKGKALSFIPRGILKKILPKVPPIRFGYCKNIKSPTGAIAEGEGVICPLLPMQILMLDEEFIINKLASCIEKLKNLGAGIVSLGGYTSVVGDEGRLLSKAISGVGITSGNVCTSVLAIQGISKASDMLDLNIGNSAMAVIGATGDIGSICSKVFSNKVRKLNIVARRQKELTEFSNVLKKYGKADISIYKSTSDAIADADIVLTATSSMTALIDPKALKPGAIVCDVALPANVPEEVLRIRNDVLVFEGGLAKFPNINDIVGKDWRRLLPFDRAFGCMTEAAVLALENRYDNYSIGRGNITEDMVSEMASMMAKHSITVSDFFCGHKFYEREDIRTIATAREKYHIRQR